MMFLRKAAQAYFSHRACEAALAAALRRLVENSEDRQRIGHAAAREVRHPMAMGAVGSRHARCVSGIPARPSLVVIMGMHRGS